MAIISDALLTANKKIKKAFKTTRKDSKSHEKFYNCMLIPPKETSGFPSKPGFHQTKIPPPRGGFHLNQASRIQNLIDPKTVK